MSADLFQETSFNLPDPFTGDPENFRDILQGQWVIGQEPFFQNQPFLVVMTALSGSE